MKRNEVPTFDELMEPCLKFIDVRREGLDRPLLVGADELRKFGGQCGIIFGARLVEHLHNLLMRQAFNLAHLDQRGFAAVVADLGGEPLKPFIVSRLIGKDVRGGLDLQRAKFL